MSSYRDAGASVYTGVLASVGTTLRGIKAPTWRTRTCPKCGAVPQEKCFRWVKESWSESGMRQEGDGRKSYNKHPHPERTRESFNDQ